MNSSLKKKIKQNETLKHFILFLISSPKNPRPRLWVKWFVNTVFPHSFWTSLTYFWVFCRFFFFPAGILYNYAITQLLQISFPPFLDHLLLYLQMRCTDFKNKCSLHVSRNIGVLIDILIWKFVKNILNSNKSLYFSKFMHKKLFIDQ